MTTFNVSPSAPPSFLSDTPAQIQAGTHRSPGLAPPPGPEIGGDLDSLAQHMRHCALRHRRFSKLHLILEDLHSLASPRIITLMALMTLLATATANAAIGIFHFI